MEVVWTTFTFSVVSPSSVALLHLLAPGGLVGAHLLAINCVSTVLLFTQLGHLLVELCWKSVACILLGTCFWHVVAVLFGAHLISGFWSTFSWAVLMSSLLFLPSSLLLSSTAADEQLQLMQWTREWLLCSFFRHRCCSHERLALLLLFSGTLLGAWLGALPIPLDWNQPWQVWPVPCSLGALLGSTAASLLAAATLTRCDCSGPATTHTHSTSNSRGFFKRMKVV